MTAPFTIRHAVEKADRDLSAAGIGTPRLDARLLVGHALSIGTETMIADAERPLAADQRMRFEGLLARRLNREPLAYLVGCREFWSLPFRVTRDTLVPRPDSETLVEAALAWVAEYRPDGGGLSVLDLGTGSGCLLLALLSALPVAHGVGVDLSAAATAVARDNAAALGLASRASFVVGDWGESLAGGFDLVIANPPYVADAEWPSLAPEIVRFEPRLALAGGNDGLDGYRAIVPQLRRLVAPGGAVVLEVGAGQSRRVAAMLADIGLQDIETQNDLGGVGRCVRAIAAASQPKQKKGWKPAGSRLVSKGSVVNGPRRDTSHRAV